MNKLPQAKTENIVVQDMKDELLVYNLATHQAYTLNETSKIVYQACDGNTSFAELKRKYQFTNDLIHLALDELTANDLLIDYRSDHFKGLSRREAIKRVGLASLVALPAISELVAPKAAEAASQPTFCNVAGRTCVAANTLVCNGRAAGTYAYTVNLASDRTNNGTCRGTATANSSFTCPNNTATSTADLCVANNPT